MVKVANVLFASAALSLLTGPTSVCAAKTPETQNSTLDANGTVHLPAVAVPLSSLASKEAKKNFLDLAHGLSRSFAGYREGSDIHALRQRIDNCMLRPGVERLRRVFPVDIKHETIAGVQTDVIQPAKGIAEKNKHRVLINLHGGGFRVAAGAGGQMESIPVAALGAVKVITVDYREAPEYRFPAASEDVAAVYQQLLQTYPPTNIGIYGCSAGGMLTAESIAWFQKHGLPRPGAIGIFGSGALVPIVGDSNSIGSLLMGGSTIPSEDAKNLPYFANAEFNIRDPLVSPAYSPSTLARFPPTLLITGTRDPGLSPAVYTHAQLIKSGVDARLHVWEGTAHCSFAQGVVDPSVPETREAWDVIVQFFDRNLGV